MQLSFFNHCLKCTRDTGLIGGNCQIVIRRTDYRTFACTWQKLVVSDVISSKRDYRCRKNTPSIKSYKRTCARAPNGLSIDFYRDDNDNICVFALLSITKQLLISKSDRFHNTLRPRPYDNSNSRKSSPLTSRYSLLQITHDSPAAGIILVCI